MKILNRFDYTRLDGVKGHCIIVESYIGLRYVLQAEPDGCTLRVFTCKKQLEYEHETHTKNELEKYIRQQKIPEDVQYILITYLHSVKN